MHENSRKFQVFFLLSLWLHETTEKDYFAPKNDHHLSSRSDNPITQFFPRLMIFFSSLLPTFHFTVEMPFSWVRRCLKNSLCSIRSQRVLTVRSKHVKNLLWWFYFCMCSLMDILIFSTLYRNASRVLPACVHFSGWFIWHETSQN